MKFSSSFEIWDFTSVQPTVLANRTPSIWWTYNIPVVLLILIWKTNIQCYTMDYRIKEKYFYNYWNLLKASYDLIFQNEKLSDCVILSAIYFWIRIQSDESWIYTAKVLILFKCFIKKVLKEHWKVFIWLFKFFFSN